MKPRSVPVSVEGYIGLPGAGKTYALAWRGLEAMRYGRAVYSNFGLAGTLPVEVWDHRNIGGTEADPCDCGRCFVSISNGVVLLDEVNLWAPSRMWQRLPLGLLHRWAQVRKYQTQVLWSAQHESRVDTVLREVTGWMWECRPCYLGRWFRYEAFEPSDLRHDPARRRRLGVRVVRLKAEIAQAYDTLQVLDVGSQFGKGRGMRQAPVRVGALPGPDGQPSGLVLGASQYRHDTGGGEDAFPAPAWAGLGSPDSDD